MSRLHASFRTLRLSAMALLVAATAATSFSAQAVTISKSSGESTPTLSDFNAQFAGHPHKVGYGNKRTDGMFLETFRLECPKGQKVSNAKFTIKLVRLSQGANAADNDALAIWDGGTQMFSAYLWQASDPVGKVSVVSLDLAALPAVSTTNGNPPGVIVSPAGGNGLSVLADNDFSFSVQDDTMVESAQLEYECGGKPDDGGKKGLTFGNYDRDKVSGIATAACQGQPGPDCNPYQGDTSCSALRPVLCIDRANLPNPTSNTADPQHWSGGVIATTPAVPGSQFANKAAVDAFCKANFGPAFEVAEFHMQPGRIGWKFGAYGSYGKPHAERAWVHIDDQPAGNCWTN